ncbi:metal ABC transporter substrate-binding protein [Candidatus Endowatersipora endosymbiont of Watersipora subatra]|uniref:metal ABC transporter substrate-binding protein n=1 Tax=Candidatus Endowatersipora endosymbiont of Watersipora subatra TaxID=3077946 RepID=UPI003C7B33CC
MRFVVIVAFVIIFQSKALANDDFKVVTVFTVIADIARNVAGDAALIESIIKPGAKIHGYQPTPRDMLKARDADLILQNGLNLELWFEKFFYQLKDVPIITLSDGINPLSIEEGPSAGKPNPHVWMSLDSAMVYVNNIRDSFMLHDRQNAKIYKTNAENYKKELKAAIAPLKARIEAIPKSQRWLVTSEGAFSYLVRDFDMQELFLWSINSDQQCTPQQVRKVIDTVRIHNIPVIFSESTVSDRPAKQIARESGARYGGVLYVDSLSENNGPVPTYLDMLRVTATTIAEGLEKR